MLCISACRVSRRFSGSGAAGLRRAELTIEPNPKLPTPVQGKLAFSFQRSIPGTDGTEAVGDEVFPRHLRYRFQWHSRATLCRSPSPAAVCPQ